MIKLDLGIGLLWCEKQLRVHQTLKVALQREATLDQIAVHAIEVVHRGLAQQLEVVLGDGPNVFTPEGEQHQTVVQCIVRVVVGYCNEIMRVNAL